MALHLVSDADLTRDEMVAVVSHELRTPLAVILGYLEVLTDTPGAIAAEHSRATEAIRRNAARLSRTVDNLLAVACRPESLPVRDRDPTGS